MNTDQHRYITRAITNYGVRLTDNVLWFADEGLVYYGKEANGEVTDYLSGFISGNTFVAVYLTSNETLDSSDWNVFITEHLELSLFDARH